MSGVPTGVLAGVLGLAAALTASAAQAAGPESAAVAGPAVREWNFAVTLDDKPIGTHRFVVTEEASPGAPSARKVSSDAAFNVKLLGLIVYRYRHQATEQWRGDCLRALSSSTDDDGAASRVRAEVQGSGLRVATEAAAATSAATSTGTAPVPPVQTLNGCVMSFAYWNPSIRTQTQLLNAQTGKYEDVKIAEARAGAGGSAGFGPGVVASRWRIEGPAQPVDVWYTAKGEWVGLDSTVGSGRKLSYRLIQ